MGMAGVISLRCLMNGENTAYTAFIFSCFPSSSFLLLISINCHAYWGDVNALLHTYLVFSKSTETVQIADFELLFWIMRPKEKSLIVFSSCVTVCFTKTSFDYEMFKF